MCENADLFFFQVHVYRKPVVAIMSTGNEIIDLSSDSPDQASIDGWGGIYDTNRPSLAAVLESLGYEVIDLGIVPDEYVFLLLTFTLPIHLIS